MKSVRQLITHTMLQCKRKSLFIFERKKEKEKRIHHSRSKEGCRDKAKKDGMISYLSESDENACLVYCENAQVCLIAFNVDLICLRPEMGQYFIRATFNTHTHTNAKTIHHTHIQIHRT